MEAVTVRGVRTVAGHICRAGKIMKMLTLVAVVLATLVVAAPTQAALVFALTDNNRLLSFDSATPGTLLGVAPISGRVGNEDLIGIDFRPSNSQLYAVGEFGTIYTINQTTAAATPVGNLTAASLQGSRFGFDFDPVSDQLRITSDTRQNLSVNVTTGVATVQGTLAYAPGDPGFGQNPNLIGIAYGNNLPGASVSTLYGLDSTDEQHRLVTVNPPATGTLQTVGSLNFSFSSLVGFDIFSAGPGEVAYAAMQNEALGISQLFSINLATGNPVLLGTIGGGDLIDGLTVIPEPATLALLSVSALALVRRRR